MAQEVLSFQQEGEAGTNREEVNSNKLHQPCKPITKKSIA
jgi:hypothetical protein